MNIETNLLAITDSAYIESPLEPDTEYQLATTITPYGSDLRSNNDGTFKRKYKARITSNVVLIKGDKVIKGKDKTRKSQKLRQALWVLNEEDGFYEAFMDKLIFNLEDVWDFLRNK